MCTFERIRNQCVRWRSIYFFVETGTLTVIKEAILPDLWMSTMSGEQNILILRITNILRVETAKNLSVFISWL